MCQEPISPEPVFDGGELLERIETVQRDSLKLLKQSDDDIDILKAYLKTQRAPKPVIEALEGAVSEYGQQSTVSRSKY